MPRTARYVVPGVPHHITQRGNNRQVVFNGEADYLRYLKHIREYSDEHGFRIWAYCLMPNHVHFIGVPEKEKSLAYSFRKTHAVYARYFNLANDRTGHLWEGRYYSCPLDPPHTFCALRYVERNPVRAGLAEAPGDYRWSSAAVHLKGGTDTVATENQWMKDAVDDYSAYLHDRDDKDEMDLIRKATRSSRSTGTQELLENYTAIRSPNPK